MKKSQQIKARLRIAKCMSDNYKYLTEDDLFYIYNFIGGLIPELAEGKISDAEHYKEISLLF